MPYRRREDRPDRRIFVIALACGHGVRKRDTPRQPRQLFGCEAGLGCGYRIPWLSVRNADGSDHSANPLFEPPDLPPDAPSG